MKYVPKHQQGASAFVTLIILVLLGYGIFIAMQYVPQLIESRTIESILSSVQDTQRTDPVDTADAASAKVIKMLQLNEMNDMTKSFTARKQNDGISITFSYDRDLNLGYKTRPIHYEKSVFLN